MQVVTHAELILPGLYSLHADVQPMLNQYCCVKTALQRVNIHTGSRQYASVCHLTHLLHSKLTVNLSKCSPTSAVFGQDNGGFRKTKVAGEKYCARCTNWHLYLSTVSPVSLLILDECQTSSSSSTHKLTKTKVLPSPSIGPRLVDERCKASMAMGGGY